MKLIKVTCARKNEKAQTITTNQFRPLVFKKDVEYLVKFHEADIPASAYVNRDGKTLYITAEDWPSYMDRAETKSGCGPKFHFIEAIYKKLRGI